MNNIPKNKTVDFRVSDISGIARREARCNRVSNSGVRGADFAKQGKLGLDVGAPREALDLTPCERGKPAGGPRSPPPFANRIRSHFTAINIKLGCGHSPH